MTVCKMLFKGALTPAEIRAVKSARIEMASAIKRRL